MQQIDGKVRCFALHAKKADKHNIGRPVVTVFNLSSRLRRRKQQ